MSTRTKIYEHFLEDLNSSKSTKPNIEIRYGCGRYDRFFGRDYRVSFIGFGLPPFDGYTGIFFCLTLKKFFFQYFENYSKRSYCLDKIQLKKVPKKIIYHLRLAIWKRKDIVLNLYIVEEWNK